MATFIYTCPNCGIEHEVCDLNNPNEYDGLCLKCEKEWVDSEEYKQMVENL